LGVKNAKYNSPDSSSSSEKANSSKKILKELKDRKANNTSSSQQNHLNLQYEQRSLKCSKINNILPGLKTQTNSTLYVTMAINPNVRKP